MAVPMPPVPPVTSATRAVMVIPPPGFELWLDCTRASLPARCRLRRDAFRQPRRIELTLCRFEQCLHTDWYAARIHAEKRQGRAQRRSRIFAIDRTRMILLRQLA